MSKITPNNIFPLPLHGNSQSTDSEQTILLRLKRHWSNPPSINHWTPSPPNSNSSIHCNWPEITCSNGSVTGLSVIDKTITGPIPTFICDLKNLTAIDLQNNYIPGPFPTALYNCTKLEHLDLSQNLFVGCIPGDVDRLSTHLQTFNLSANNFTCEISTGLSSWKNLTVFSASNNLFVGTIPQELTTFSQLTALLPDGNLFSGHLPSDIVSWKSLTTLNLSRNQLWGSVSAKLGSLPSLTVLDLSRNEFLGQIPTQIGHLKLTSLNLSSNCLTGRIPAEFENTFSDGSFLNNTGLCASNPSLGPEICSSRFENSSKISSGLLAIIVVIATVLLASATLLTFFLIKTCRKKEHESDSKWELTYYQKLNLSFKESDILSNLTENNVIGRGGSGKVYRVELNCPSELQFLAEVEILGTIRHSNIVNLLSCISSETTKLIVYEYMGNHSLYSWLHGKKRQSISDSDHGVVLDWPKRLKIAVGAVRGQCYMHHDCKPSVIHRDILVKHGGPNTMSAVVGTDGYN
ncbi:unnamed protein product [Camellia sinensis]